MYSVEDAAGVNVDITLFEYNDAGERIKNNVIKMCKNGTDKSFQADPSCSKVKVHVKMYNILTSRNSWVQQVFYLNKNGNTTIKIEGSTLTGSTEP